MTLPKSEIKVIIMKSKTLILTSTVISGVPSFGAKPEVDPVHFCAGSDSSAPA